MYRYWCHTYCDFMTRSLRISNHIHTCTLDKSTRVHWMNTSTSAWHGKLPQQHPEIYKQFKAGHFTAQKTKRPFSAMPHDQAHEQSNPPVSSDGGVVGLTDNPTALKCWMVVGPEVARWIMEFVEENTHLNASEETHYHEETASAQKTFARDVQSLVAVIEELGNHFEEDV